MAAPVNANINVLVNTQQAMAQLRSLQAQVATLNKSISATSGAAAAQQAALAKGLKDSANASRMWQARIVPMNTSVNQFSEALDRGRMSLGQYSRYAASQLPGMRRAFKREFDMMSRVAEQNVRRMQTQYMTLGNSAAGAAQAMAFTPTALNKQAAATAMAAQRQMMMNRMIDLGTTKLLNYGKNTQWAGRQLMVGFSIPLAMVGAVAAKTFKEIDQGSIAFKRVYGDLSTTTAEMEKNLEAVKDLGNEYTKYGIKLADTLELAADIAATGAKNTDLLAATEQTLRLATLGLMEHQEALEATISLQTAFGVSSEELGSTIDFLNVVENETILTMQDMAAAIPRVAPVVRGLGGDVKDLSVLMTAMREGGVTAGEGANALKTGLGRLINPTRAAREVMAGFGMSIDQIVMSNKGDLMGIIQSFGDALSRLGDFEQQQVLEKVFGKRQYARLGALFKNLANDASQANKTIELTNMSMQDLASISERELGKIEEATSTKFAASVEKMKVAIAPIGETFMKALMPIINFIADLLNKFNNMPDNIKNAIAIAIGAIAGLGPVILMTIGLIANGIANIGKFIQLIRKFFARLKGDASLFNYLTREEQEATAAAQGLSGATETLTTKFLGQQKALERLIQLVGTYASALRNSAAAAPIGMGVVPGRMGGMVATRGAAAAGTRKYQSGVVGVPGSGRGDKIPALLEPGESVVTRDATQRYAPVLSAMNAGNLQMLSKGMVGAKLPAGAGGVPITFDPRSAQRIENVLNRLNAWLAEGHALDQAQVTELRRLIGTQKVTGDSLKQALRTVTGEQGRFSARGERLKEGSGKTSAPGWVARQSKQFAQDPRIQAEQKMLARQFGPGGATPLTAGQFRNIQGVEASHIRRVAPGMDKWAGQAANLNPELGAIQKYLERIRKSYTTWSQSSVVADALSKEFNGDMRVVNQQIDNLAKGVAPLDEQAHKAVKTFADLDMQLSRAAMAAGQTHSALGTVAKTAMSTAAPASHLAGARLSGASPYFASGGGALRYAPVETSQAVASSAKAGTQMGSAMGINLVRAAESTTKDVVKRILVGSGHRSPAALMGKTGAEDGNAYGRNWVASLNRILRTAKVIPPMPAGPSSPIASGRILDNKSFKELSGMLRQDLALARKELGNAFRQIPAFAHESLRNIKPVFSKLGQLFLDLNPWITKSVDSIRRFLTKVSYIWMGLKLTGLENLGKVLTRAKSAYETVMLQTMMAWDKVKALPAKARGAYETAMLQAMMAWDKVKMLPAKAKSAYETAMLRTMMTWDSLKRMPAQMTNRISTFMSDLPRTLQRLRSQIFYRGQDTQGRAVQATAPLRDPSALIRAGVTKIYESLLWGSLRFVEAMERVIAPIRTAITNAFNSAVQLVRSGATKLYESLIMGAVKAIGGIENVVGLIRKATFKNAAQLIRSGATRVYESLLWSSVRIITAIENAPSRMRSAFDSATQLIRSGVTRVYESLLWGSVRLVEAIERAPSAIRSVVTNTFNSAMQLVRAGATKVYESFLWGSIQVVSGIEQTFTKIRTSTAAKWNQVLMAFNAANLRQSVSRAWEGIRGAATQGAKNVRDSLINAGTAIRNAGSVAAKMIALTAAGGVGAAKGIGGFLGTVNEKTGRTRAQSIGTASNSAVMGLMGLSMAASFAGGEVGEMAQKIMPVTMGLLGLQMILPMLKTPFGLAMVAVAALAAVFIKTRKDLDNFAKEAANAGANLGGFANRMKAITDATGYQFAGQRAQERLFRFTDVEKEAVSEFSDYFESEGGQKFLKDLRELSNEDRYNEVAKMISFAIADGMDEETAKEYGYSIAYYLGDAVMKQRLESDFAAERFAGGIDKVIEIIEQRQAKLDELLARFEPENVGQSGAARGLARATGIGEFDTQKSMFAEGVGKMGAVAGLGAAGGLGAGALISAGTMFGSTLAVPGLGTAAVGTRIGAMIGGITGPIGMAIGALAGTAIGAIIAWKQYQKQVAELNENVGMGAMILGNSVQTLGEVRNAEALLIEQYRQGLINRQQYIDEMERLNNIERSAEQGIGAVVDSMIMGGQMDTGALMQAMQDQFVLAGFEGDLAKAITGIVNPETVGKTIFPENTMDEIMADVSKRNVVATVIAETLAGITPENAQQKIADVQNLWAGMADDLVNAAADGLTLDEMRAMAAGKAAGETIFNALMSGAEEGMAGGGVSPADTSPEGYRAAAKAAGAAARGEALPEGTTVSTQADGTQRVEIDGTTYTLSEQDLADMVRPTIPKGPGMEGRSESSYKQEAQNIIDRILDDTNFSEENVENLQNILEKTGMSAEDFFAQAFAENQQFREDFVAAREAGNITDEQLTEMGFGETGEEIQSAIDAAVEKSDIIIDLSDLGFTVVGAEQTARVIADDWAGIIEGMGEDSTGTQLQIGLDAATRALGEETMAELAAASQPPEISGPVADARGDVTTGEDLVDLINKLSDEKFSGINLQDAIAQIFATEADSLDEAFDIYEEKYGGLSEIFGDETQKVIDYLEGVGNEAGITAQEIAEIGSVVKALPDEMAGRLGVDKQDPESYAEIDPQQLEILQQYWSIYSQLPEDVNILSSLQFLTLDEEGNPVTAKQAIANRNELEKLIKDISETKDLKVKKELITEFVEKNTGIDPVEFGKTYDRLVRQFGPKKIANLGVDQIIKAYNLDTEITANKGALAELKALYGEYSRFPGWENTEAAKNMRTQIKTMEDAVASGESSLAQTVLDTPRDTSGTSGTSGSGGGSKEKSFMETLKEGLLEQIQMWGSATASAKDLNNVKSSFVQEVLKGQGLFDKLLGIKGLSSAQLRQILEGGPEGMKEFLNEYTTKSGKVSKEGQRILDLQTITGSRQARRDLRTERITSREQVRAVNYLRKNNVDEDVIENIAGDPDSAARVVELLDMTKRGVKGAEEELQKFIKSQGYSVKQAERLEKAIDPIGFALKKLSEEQEKMNLVFQRRESEFQREFGRIDREYRPRIKAQQDILDGLEDQRKAVQDQIDDIRKLNSADERRIRSEQRRIEMLEREKQAIQEQIDQIERANELDQRRMDTISRQDEIRNRVAEALNKELDDLAKSEEEIQETYEKRTEALDKVIEANDYIISQQKKQVNLSRAIAEGDIYAATQAAQEMRAESGRFALQQVRTGLETGMENQLGNLRTASGLSREEAEKRILEIEEQSYQTSLKIREIEDLIYERNLQMIPLKDQIRDKDLQISNIQKTIQTIQDAIYDRQTQIMDIEVSRLEPLNDQIEAEQLKLEQLNDEIQSKKDSFTVDGLTYEQHQDIVDSHKEEWAWIEANIKASSKYGEQVGKVVDQWNAVAKAIAEANRLSNSLKTNVRETAKADVSAIEIDPDITPSERRAGIAARQAAAQAELDEIESNRRDTISQARARAQAYQSNLSTAYAGGLVAKYALGGSVSGMGTRDSVPAMLTPGEFIVRKAMVDKYGTPFFEAINQGAFSVPRYSVPETGDANVIATTNNMTSINAPVYNTYDMKFSINGTNQNPDEIANKVMFKMRQLQNQNIRGNRG